MAEPDDAPAFSSHPTGKRKAAFIRNLPAVAEISTTVVSGIGFMLVFVVVVLPYGQIAGWVSELPPTVVWFAVTAAVIGTFAAGTFTARASARRTRQSALDLQHVERQIARARMELASVEQATADRSVEYAQLGARIHEASEMLTLTQSQYATMRRALERVAARTQRSWWVSVLIFGLGIAFGYLTEWTADGLKPPWLP